MNVKMYNAFFGDCFVIENEDRNLMVDFGVRNGCKFPPGKNIDLVLNEITDDISTTYGNRNLDLLITHFHYDHISGLTRLHRVGMPAGLSINNVYIPNIWDFPFVVATNLLEEALVRINLGMARVPGYRRATQEGLLDLLEFLISSTNIRRIGLLKRGDVFENGDYLTLLPDDRILRSIVQRYGELNLPPLFRDLQDDVEQLAREICGIINNNRISEDVGISIRPNENFAGNISGYRERFGRIISRFSNILAEQGEGEDFDIEDTILALNSLNNEISVVFHNSVSGDKNILFTGDAENVDIARIAGEDDYPMHESYRLIKAPHHGTESHYYDFSPYEPEWILIPSGRTPFNGGRTRTGRTRGDDRISDLYNALGENKLCSNSNHCKMCTYGCIGPGKAGCSSIRHTVFPRIFRNVHL